MVEDNPGDARLIEELLKEAPSVRFDTVRVERLADALDKLGKQHFDVVLLDLRLPDSQGIETFIAVRDKAPQATVVVLTGLYDETLAVSAVANGAQDYLVKGHLEGDELARAIRYAIARHARETQAPPQQPRGRGKVLGFMGAKGGSGTTTVVLNLAAALAKQDKDVVAVEFRSCCGSFATLLKTAAARNLSHLLDLDPEKIDAEEVNSCLATLSYGPKVLLGPQRVEEYKEIDPPHAQALVEALAGMCDYALLDLPSYPCPGIRAAIQHCDYVTLIVEREPASVESGKVAVELLRSWDVGANRLGAAFVTRVPSTTAPNLREVGAAMGCTIVGAVPPAAESFADAERRSLPLVLSEPDSLAAVNLTAMAKRLSGDVVEPMTF
jgi:Flp pilus assembly CpaE family ATPase